MRNESYWFCLQVVTDSGALALEEVFELISEGENLPVIAEEELQVSKKMNVNKHNTTFTVYLKLFVLLWLIWCSHYELEVCYTVFA